MASAEVRLWSTKQERETLDLQADIYAIIKTAEKLEKAYVRDAVDARFYEDECFDLIAKFKTLRATLGPGALNMEAFIAEYRLDRECPLAVNRLMRAGVPATVEHGAGAGARGGGAGGAGGAAAAVAEAVQHFITIMDSLKLNMVAADQVYPLLNDLLLSLAQLRLGGANAAAAAGPVKLRAWLGTVNSMRASEELSAEQVRQLLFDLDSAYTEFMGAIKGGAAAARGS